MRTVILVMFRLAALVLCVFTVLPVVPADEWFVRIFDFPRVQIIAAMAATLIVLIVASGQDRRALPAGRHARAGRLLRVGFPAALAGAMGWQAFRIFPYTPLAPLQLPRADNPDPDRTIRLLIFNVRYDNTDAGALLDLIAQTNPDAILLVEPTARWDQQLEPLTGRFSHAVRQPQENHYGILLFSRFELIDPEIRFLVESEVPSVRTGVRLPSGDTLTLYGLHPKPPGLKRPVDRERADAEQRDAELLTVAKEVRESGDGPVIVAGDFNDVAWSHTTRLFQRISGLLDPRVGRGLYNTYNARSALTRFPLDHVFVSEHFRLVDMRVLPPTGSDHHPVLITLAYDPADPEPSPNPTPDPGDLEEANQAIDDGITPDDD